MHGSEPRGGEETSRLTHDEVSLALALTIARRSRDPSTRVGCVITRPNRTIASAGYNGFPRGVEDTPGRYADRKAKYLYTCHAEANAIVTAAESLEGFTLYCTHTPCNECAKLIIQAGIKYVKSPPPTSEFYERWGEGIEATLTMFKEANVLLEWLTERDHNPNQEHPSSDQGNEQARVPQYQEALLDQSQSDMA